MNKSNDYLLLSESSIFSEEERLELLNLTLADFFTKERLNATNMQIKTYHAKIQTWIKWMSQFYPRLQTIREFLENFSEYKVRNRSKNVGAETAGVILGMIAHYGLRFLYESQRDQPTGAFSMVPSDYADEPEDCF
jgi:hypothetical protein